jgi:hypothetical protein
MDERKVWGYDTGVGATQSCVVIRPQGNMCKAGGPAAQQSLIGPGQDHETSPYPLLRNQFICCRIEDISGSEIGGHSYLYHKVSI